MVRLWFVVAVLAVGCTGKVRGTPDADVGPADVAVTDAKDATKPPGDATSADLGCSASGVASNCDPITNTGCSAGACYVTKAGFACVCPVGTATLGGECTTTVDCAPTNVCAGTQAPGACRTICDPGSATACGGGEFCIAIQNYTTIGYCTPHD